MIQHVRGIRLKTGVESDSGVYGTLLRLYLNKCTCLDAKMSFCLSRDGVKENEFSFRMGSENM